MWFRRDLRLQDNPALDAAFKAGQDAVIPLFVLDPKLWDASGAARRSYLLASLQSLNASLDGSLHVLHGQPPSVIPDFAQANAVTSVHITEDFGPYGRQRDLDVQVGLGSIPLIRTGSAYAVSPGRVTKADGSPYRLFTPFHRAWLGHGWPRPASGDAGQFLSVGGRAALPRAPELPPELTLPAAGEHAAWEQWARFREGSLADYADHRDRADLSATSGMSQHIRWGEIHPRSLLAELASTDEAFRRELCWREFYADSQFHSPDSARQSLDPRFDFLLWAQGASADHAFELWCQGRTGYPMVDAGMRQLRSEAWMHNRVRMVVASPVLQGVKFDPEGEYVRRHVPELQHLTGAAVHEPWKHGNGYAGGYPPRCVDHAQERLIALEDYSTIRQSSQR